MSVEVTGEGEVRCKKENEYVGDTNQLKQIAALKEQQGKK